MFAIIQGGGFCPTKLVAFSATASISRHKSLCKPDAASGRRQMVPDWNMRPHYRHCRSRPIQAFDAENTPPEEPDAIKERYRRRLFHELGKVAVKRGHEEKAYLKGVKTLEAILGVFTPDMSVMKESEWADMIVDADSLAKKIVIMKTHFPSMDTVHMLLKKPKVFTLDIAELDVTCQQICHLLKEAKDPGKIISDTPDLMEPAMVASALVTFKRKWPEKDPVKLLEEEGAYWLRFFSDTEMPLDPVYYDGKTWAVPAFDTEAKQQPWKTFIAEKAKKEMERSKAQGFIF